MELQLPPGFELHRFEALTPELLYQILALRQVVFIVEQRCMFLDADGRDRDALHLLYRAPPGSLRSRELPPDTALAVSRGEPAPELIAYARLFLPTAAKPASFGRVITAPNARMRGLGHRLVDVALEVLAGLAPGADVHIAAQAHLDTWYSKHRFEPVGEPYLDDGIPHLDMVRRWGSK